MRTNLRVLFVSAIIIAMSFGFFGISLSADKEPIKWGFLDCMSGAFGVFGKGNINGTKLAIKEINDSGGILGRRIEMIVEDTEANTEIAARKARKLMMKDKVDVIQGSASTSVTSVIMKLIARNKTLHLNSEFDSASILPSKSNYSFDFAPLCEESESARMLAFKMKFKPSEIKRWFLLYPDYSYGRDMRDWYKRKLKELIPGAEIVGMVKHQFGETDFSTHIVKIMEANPQVIASFQWSGDALNFIRQADQLGFFQKFPLFYFNGASIAAVVALKDKMPVLWGLTEQGNPYSPKMKTFLKKYYDYFGEYPVTENVTTYYDTVYMYKAAVEKAGTTNSDAVAKALVGMKYIGPGGMRKVRKDHFVDVDSIDIVKWAPGEVFEWNVPTEIINVPYDKVRLTEAELVEMGCKWCEGKGR
jgi:branched-chain amino acid transport system substrate-binding protein